MFLMEDKVEGEMKLVLHVSAEEVESTSSSVSLSMVSLSMVFSKMYKSGVNKSGVMLR